MTEPTPTGPPPGDDQPADQPDQQPPQPAKPDTGNDEVAKWKALARKHEDAAKANRAAADKLAKLEEASKSEQEKAVTAARKDAEDAVHAHYRQQRVLDRIEVLAAKDFADPEDARLRLGGRVDDLIDGDGHPDPAAIKSALDDLLKTRPHLAARQPDGRPRGDADLGPRTTAPKRAGSLTDAIAAHYTTGAPPR